MRYSNVLFNCIKSHINKCREFNKNLFDLIKNTYYGKFDVIPYTLGQKLGEELDKELRKYLKSPLKK